MKASKRPHVKRKKKTLPVGRPCLLDPIVAKRLVNAIRRGNHRIHAAQYAGIARPTLYLWLKRGHAAAKGDEEFVALLAAIQKAEGIAIDRNIRVIQTAAATQWQAAGWWLERKYAKQFGRRDQNRVEMSGPNGGSISISSGVVVLPPVSDDEG